MHPFTFEALPSRVIFGSGTMAAAGNEMEALGVRRALVLSTREQESAARKLFHSSESRPPDHFATLPCTRPRM